MRALLVVAVATLAIGCSTPRPTSPSAFPSLAPPPQQFQVSGRTIDLSTSTPAPGVTLVWQGLRGSSLISTEQAVSASDGRYTITLSSADRYLVRVNDGIPGTVYVPRSPYATDFFVNPGGCIVWYGVVMDALRKTPIAGARASMSHSNAEAFSGADGTFRLTICGGLNSRTGTTAWGLSHPMYMNGGYFGTRAEFLGGAYLRRDDILLTPWIP